MKQTKEQVILFRTHFIDNEVIKQYRLLKESCGDQYDVILLYDNSFKEVKNTGDCEVHEFNIDDIRNMGFPLWEGRHVWFHMDYAVLHFFRTNRNYRNYWVIEYDVRFEGNWKDFFCFFSDNSSDLLATYLRRYQEDPLWRWWNEHNLDSPKEEWLAIFCPLLRISNKALHVLQECHEAGLGGYAEMVIPTVLQKSGLLVNDIGRKFYDPLTSFNFNGIIYRRRGQLAHPVKNTPFFNKAVSLFRYIFRACYDSHWSVQWARFVLFKVLRFPERSY